MKNIKIYQIVEEEPWMFMSYDFAINHGFNTNAYNLIYECERNINSLDDIFEEFNIRHPKDFHGHSLSVSDIVEIDDTKYYCDNFDWKRLSNT